MGRSWWLVVGVAALACVAGCSAPSPEADSGPSEEVVRHTIRGTALLGQQKWGDAETEFRAAAALAPDDPLPVNDVAVALMQQGRIDEARTELDRALHLDPDYPQAHYNLGLIAKNDGDFATAAEHFEAVARNDPDDLLTQYNLGVVLSRIDRGAEAEAAFRRALELDPTHVSSLYGLGRYLLQTDRQQEGAELVARSQEIRSRSGLDEAVGSQYGEQGPYAMGVDYPGDALAAPAPIEVDWTALADVAADGAVAPAATRAASGVPVVLIADGARLCPLGRSADAAACAPEAPTGLRIVAVAAGSIDGDDELETVALLDGVDGPGLAVLDAPGEQSQPAWSTGEGTAWRLPPGALAAGAALTLVDCDHDGDLDVFACWPGERAGCVIGTNDGSGAFTLRDTAADHGFGLPPGFGGPLSVAFSDADDDRDVDLLVAGAGGVRLLANQRDGSFEDVSDERGLGAASGAVVALRIADLDKNGFMDVVTAGPAGLRWQRNGLKGFAAPETIAADPATGLEVLDYDNDGFLDLASGRDGVPPQLHRNLGRSRFDVDAATLDAAGAGARPRAALDVDEDGDLDLVVDAAGRAIVLANQGGDANGWIEVDSVGVGDNRSGIGAKVEILAGALRQKFEITGPLPLHAGLGARDAVESVRYLWPGGVLQDEIDQPADRRVTITQLDRKGTSCPLLYARRDGAWRFVTDFLGGSAIGYLHAPGVYGTPDTDEYVLVEGGLDTDADGLVHLRLNNQLEEVIWFDQAQLLAVDHPAGSIVVPDERLMPGPPFPAFRLFASRDVRAVAAARTLGDGRDVTATLARRDRDTVADFGLLPYKGYAEPHTLELDLGPFPSDGRAVLLLDGWIDYADSSSNLAASQAGVALEPPVLQLADGRGGWIEPDHLMGFPAGLPKTMAVELSGRFPSDDHRLRIRTSMRIYWDRARVLVGGESLPLDVRRLAPESAELRFGGFPRRTSPDGRPPFAYDPSRVDERGGFKAHAGAYTPFGEVTPLLAAIDDQFVTTRNGDELELAFRAPAPPAPGMTRSWLLFADGFGKDMDLNSLADDEVGPVPFHGMPCYPYADGIVPPAPQDHLGRPARVVPRAADGLPGALSPAIAPARVEDR